MPLPSVARHYCTAQQLSKKKTISRIRKYDFNRIRGRRKTKHKTSDQICKKKKKYIRHTLRKINTGNFKNV